VALDSNRYKPYSKIIDKLAIPEPGYYVNRKVAKLIEGNWQTRS